jgi:hypothetical protein
MTKDKKVSPDNVSYYTQYNDGEENNNIKKKVHDNNKNSN